jgi:hypothetical protein
MVLGPNPTLTETTVLSEAEETPFAKKCLGRHLNGRLSLILVIKNNSPRSDPLASDDETGLLDCKGCR